MSNYLLRYKSKLMRSELIIIPLIIIPIHLSAKLIFRIMKNEQLFIIRPHFMQAKQL